MARGGHAFLQWLQRRKQPAPTLDPLEKTNNHRCLSAWPYCSRFVATRRPPPQAVRTERNMSLELANQIAAGAVAACAANGYNVAATVVDRAGTVRAVQRADNAGPHTLAQPRRPTPRPRPRRPRKP
jgi:fatty acid/phospholipid biosynthesis enzyme